MASKPENAHLVGDELVDFENDMMKMIKNIEFRNINCTFQTKLISEIKKRNESNDLSIPADKSRNIYIYIYIYHAKGWLQQICKRQCNQNIQAFYSNRVKYNKKIELYQL